MSRIQLLDDTLINKIAAGEVVERPASVVKELIENSLDAGAAKITVELQEGGRKRILISDNGSGMSRDDASKAMLRHATSKIRSAEDLFNLHTMGFRGEALASISAVCRFTLMTCEQGSATGVRLQSDGGAAGEEAPWQSSGGTTIICDDLFYNVPVRQKFLKAAPVEYSAVLELMQALSLAHPSVDFTLIHNGKEVLRAPAVPGNVRDEAALRKRFSQVMRGDAGLGMVYTAAECPYGSMMGLISAPGVERGSAKDMFLFINGRWVKDKSLRFAALRGYHSHLLRGKYPVVAVFLTVDPGLVDANVHPAKTEVRLQYANELHSMVAAAVREGLRRADWAAKPSMELPTSSRSSVVEDIATHDTASKVSAPKDSLWSTPASLRMSTPRAKSDDSFSAPSPARWREVTPKHGSLFDDLASATPENQHPVAVSAAQSVPWSELTYMGSIADCYLLFSHGDRRSGARLLGVDQHAFHERVLYERLARNTELLKSSQTLLVPEGLTLTAKEVGALTEMKSILEGNGFRFDVLDDETIEVRAVPILLAKSDLQVLMESIARHHDSNMPLENNIGLTHDLLSTMACHGAVRAGEKLGENELRILVNEAHDVDFFHNCPHGRRVFRWWDEAQIARWFDR
jgi:DNA mismatch repair protein MutL